MVFSTIPSASRGSIPAAMAISLTMSCRTFSSIFFSPKDRCRSFRRTTSFRRTNAISYRDPDLIRCQLSLNRRFKDNWERIKSGSLYEMALVLRKLVVLRKERHLSFGEKKMLENVRQLIVSEIAIAAGIDPREADGMVEKTIATA